MIHLVKSSKGGMCANAFGGHARLDHCNLLGQSWFRGPDGGLEPCDVASNASPERNLWLCSIQDAAFNYKFFGLGRNGTEGSEYWHAVDYIFYVRAAKSASWENAPRRITQTYQDESLGRRVSRKVELSKFQVKAMCLDFAWDHLEFPITLDTFCDRLKKERLKIVRENWGQIRAFLNLPGSLETWERALVCPSEPEDVERLLRFRQQRKPAVLQKESNSNREERPVSAQAQEAA